MAPRVEGSASLSVEQPQVWHNLPLGHHHRPATRTEHPVSRSEAGQRDWVGLLPAGLAPLTGQYKAGVHLLEVSQMGTDTGPDVRTSPGVALSGRSIVRSLYVRFAGWTARRRWSSLLPHPSSGRPDRYRGGALFHTVIRHRSGRESLPSTDRAHPHDFGRAGLWRAGVGSNGTVGNPQALSRLA